VVNFEKNTTILKSCGALPLVNYEEKYHDFESCGALVSFVKKLSLFRNASYHLQLHV
jgi:hypothetical protein